MEKQEIYDKNYICTKLKELGNKHNLINVFNDFLSLVTYSISNAVNFDKARENQYLNIINKYNKN